MHANITRRSLLTASAFGIASAGLAASLSSPAAASASEAKTSSERTWTDAADLIVVGGGGAGICASIEAARANSSVLVLEKNDFCGGDTVRSGGMIMAGGTDIQAQLGIDDTVERFVETELGYVADSCNRDMVIEMCQEAPEQIRLMQELGRTFDTLTSMKPIAGYDDDAVWAPRTHWAATDRTGHFVLLMSEAERLGVRALTGVEVAHLIQDETGTVIGVEDSDGLCYRANKGVVISTASFGRNKEMSRRYNKMNYWALSYEENFPKASPNYQCLTNTGDGIRMAQEIGADLALCDANCIADITAQSFGPACSSIIVNESAQRFVQESAHWGYLNQVAYMEAVKTGATDTSTIHFWIIADQAAVEQNSYYSCLVNEQQLTGTPAYFDLIVSAGTIEELAEKTGLDSEALVSTVSRWNSMVDAGEDTDFGRHSVEAAGSDEMERIEKAPFYAFPYIPYSMGSFGGLRTNAETQVLDTAGNPIPRLYAAGAVMSGMYTAPFYNACGWSILGTMVWGRKAGRAIAALDVWTDEPVEPTVSIEGADKQIEDAISTATGSYVAGSYTATGIGHGGEVPVTVEFSDTAITAISVGDNAESAGIGTEAAKIMPVKILIAQNTDVDSVSGATITSIAINTAVADCIEQARK